MWGNLRLSAVLLTAWCKSCLYFFLSHTVSFCSAPSPSVTFCYHCFVFPSASPRPPRWVSAVTGVRWGGRPADLNVLISPTVQLNSWTQHQSTACSSDRRSSRSLSFSTTIHSLFLLTKYSRLPRTLGSKLEFVKADRNKQKVVKVTSGFVRGLIYWTPQRPWPGYMHVIRTID